MAKIRILQKDAPVLRKIAQSVPVADIKSKKIQNLLDKMMRAMHAEEDGVAIAAPQVGQSLRIFVVNGAIGGSEDIIFINPEIIKASQKKRRMEEGCLSIRYLYGLVKRSEKITIRAYDREGRRFQRGASGLLAQIFQHETDHLDGVLFIDKAENIQDMPPTSPQLRQGSDGQARLRGTRPQALKFVFFGSSQFSTYVLEELEKMGLSPIRSVTSSKTLLPAIEELKKLNADVFVVASFGKILSKEIIELPKHGTLNVHPSLLPQLRGASPIQGTILGRGEPGVTIIKMDEKMDHGPILVQAKVPLTPWPDHYNVVEEKLGRVGGMLLGMTMAKLASGDREDGEKIEETPQDDSGATYTKLIKKEDGLLDLDAPAEENLRKVLAYSTWPGAYINFKRKNSREVRVVIKDAKVEGGKFAPTCVIPAGKREMGWQDFLRGN